MLLVALLLMSAAPLLTSAYLVSTMTQRTVSRPASKRSLMRRQSSFKAFLPQEDSSEYLINMTVGTPPQSMSVIFDTGSSDLFVPSTNNTNCQQGMCTNGAFSPGNSSTHKVLIKNGFSIQFADPTDTDQGDWVDETVTIGGSKAITKTIMGVTFTGFDPIGLIGVGYPQNEAIPNPAGNGSYASVLDNMVTQGLIARKSFGMHLGSVNQSGGSVCFGCIDGSKFTGQLTALPIQTSTSPDVPEFYVTLSSIVLTDAVGAQTKLTPEGYAQSTLLDSGTSMTFLTNDVVEPLVRGMGAVAVDFSDDQDGSQVFNTVPCALQKTNATLTYTFGGADGSGKSIVVPLSEVIGNGGSTLNSSEFASEEGGCDLGIEGPLTGVSILGDTFLRSAYAVFDLENDMIAMAQAKVDSSDETDEDGDGGSITEIPKGAGFPGVNATATAPGTQLPSAKATIAPDLPAASKGDDGRIQPGTPTFNLVAAQTAD